MAHRDGLSTWIRHLEGLGVCLTLLFTIALTINLICETHPLVPESFVSWTELGCSPRNDKESPEESVIIPQFIGITECGRGYIARTPRDAYPLQDVPTKTTIFDIWSNQELCNNQAIARFCFEAEVLSRSRRFLLQSRGNDVVLRDLVKRTEAVIKNDFDGFPQFSFNKDRDTALIRTNSGGVVWDLTNGKQFTTIQRLRKARSFGFTDSIGRAKCLTISGSVEIWNEEEGLREFVLADESRFEGFQLSSDSRTMAVIESGQMAIWSLEDGSMLHRISNHRFLGGLGSGGSALYQCKLSMALSNNSRWLLDYRHYQQDPLITRVEEWNSTVGRLLCAILPNGETSELIDLQTGRTWSGMPCVIAGTFSDDDSRLVTFSEDGKYVWSVPPRRQRAATYAWVAILGWGSLIAILWRLRKARRALVSNLRRFA